MKGWLAGRGFGSSPNTQLTLSVSQPLPQPCFTAQLLHAVRALIGGVGGLRGQSDTSLGNNLGCFCGCRMEADGKMYVKYQVIGKNNVAVPTHFFKVLILEKESGEIELRSYVMPNSPVDDKIPLERFLVPIESIERASGLLFVPNILRRTSNLKAITAGKH